MRCCFTSALTGRVFVLFETLSSEVVMKLTRIVGCQFCASERTSTEPHTLADRTHSQQHAARRESSRRASQVCNSRNSQISRALKTDHFGIQEWGHDVWNLSIVKFGFSDNSLLDWSGHGVFADTGSSGPRWIPTHGAPWYCDPSKKRVYTMWVQGRISDLCAVVQYTGSQRHKFGRVEVEGVIKEESRKGDLLAEILQMPLGSLKKRMRKARCGTRDRVTDWGATF